MRFSADIDLFHDVFEEVDRNADFDAATLRDSGFAVDWLIARPGFRRAQVARGAGVLRIEWVHDSAFRFFPVVEDAVLGFRLHDADLAVNKTLAGVGRLVIRDFIDLLDLDSRYLRLGALAWAAPGKDPGLTPLLILNELNRHARYRPEDLAEVRLREPVDLVQLKQAWLRQLAAARELVETLPPEECGCLYIGVDGEPVTPPPGEAARASLLRHFGSLRGSWPRAV